MAPNADWFVGVAPKVDWFDGVAPKVDWLVGAAPKGDAVEAVTPNVEEPPKMEFDVEPAEAPKMEEVWLAGG